MLQTSLRGHCRVNKRLNMLIYCYKLSSFINYYHLPAALLTFVNNNSGIRGSQDMNTDSNDLSGDFALPGIASHFPPITTPAALYLVAMMLVLLASMLMLPVAYGEVQAPAAESNEVYEPAEPRAGSRSPSVPLAAANKTLLNLAADLPDDQVLWLEGREYDPTAVMALYLPASQAAAKRRKQGGVILLHDLDQHPDWPHITGYLRIALADHGWHTLSLALQYPPSQQMPERDLLPRSAAQFPMTDAIPRVASTVAKAATAKSADGLNDAAELATEEDTAVANPTGFELPSRVDTDSTVDIDAAEIADGENNSGHINNAGMSQENDAQQVVTNSRRLALGLQQLQSRGIENHTIIGVGEGARQILLYLRDAAAGLSMPAGIVLINASFGKDLLRELANKPPAWSDLKILDIYDSTHPALNRAARERQQFARQNGLGTSSGNRPGSYQQSSIPGLLVLPGGSSSRLLSRIRSWQQRLLLASSR